MVINQDYLKPSAFTCRDNALLKFMKKSLEAVSPWLIQQPVCECALPNKHGQIRISRFKNQSKWNKSWSSLKTAANCFVFLQYFWSPLKQHEIKHKIRSVMIKHLCKSTKDWQWLWILTENRLPFWPLVMLFFSLDSALSIKT